MPQLAGVRHLESEQLRLRAGLVLAIGEHGAQEVIVEQLDVLESVRGQPQHAKDPLNRSNDRRGDAIPGTDYSLDRRVHRDHCKEV